MLINESKWIGKKLLELIENKKVSNILNLGSSTGQFREVEQAFIYNNIFAPLKNTKAKVTHLDMKNADGVDLVGDITNKDFFNQIKNNKYNCIICSNLLEHIENPERIIDSIYNLLEQNGYLILTLPFNYPYHPDPIDTYYRPNLEEIKLTYNKFSYIKGETIVDNETHFSFLIKKPKSFITTVIRLILPFYKTNSWKLMVNDLGRTFKPFSANCVILKKVANDLQKKYD